MSRLLIACSLIAALTTSSMARAVEAPRFAAPPPEASEVSIPEAAYPHDPGLREQRVLDRTTVRIKLAARRATNLARFRAYVRAGVFPSNTFEGRKLNVWRDADGHLCAAATIINASGLGELVTRVAEQTNFIPLADVRQGPLMDWILTSGLTQDEIAAIQEPFMPVMVPEPAPRPIMVDARLRAREDARLAKRYKQVDKMIVKNRRKSLELAVDRLMQRQDLAWQLVNG